MKLAPRKWSLIALVCSTLLGGCGSFQLVSAYDEVIDKGILDFTEQLNAHVKNMAELGGQAEGTYAANLKTYNALDARIDVLIDRAANAAEGQSCSLQNKVYARLGEVFKNKAPSELKANGDATPAQASACNTRLLTLVKDQLALIREIHKTTDTCGTPAVSCIRPATAKDMLPIANQTLNAASIVEAAKKKS